MCLGIVIYEWEELLFYLVPALQAAPQPIRADHMQVFALLCLAHLLCTCRDNMSACLPCGTRVESYVPLRTELHARLTDKHPPHN